MDTPGVCPRLEGGVGNSKPGWMVGKETVDGWDADEVEACNRRCRDVGCLMRSDRFGDDLFGP